MTEDHSPSPPQVFRRALVVFNPAAGVRRQRRLEKVLQGLAPLGYRHELFWTRQPGDAEEAARTAGERGFDLLLAAGGDGTVNEAANGIAAAAKSIPLALLPLGTANVLAAEIGLSARPEAVLRMIAGGRQRTIRLGQAGSRLFVLMASAGVDAAVVHHVDLALKRRTGRLAYAVEAFRQGASYGFPQLSVTVDGIPHTARMVVVCKARCYGGRFQAAPSADLGDDLLQVVLLERGGLSAVLRYGLALGLGRLSRLPDVTVLPARRVVIDGPAGGAVQADGDPVGLLPLPIAVSDHTVELVVP
jgi:diacylglycerol kinase (ATP)